MQVFSLALDAPDVVLAVVAPQREWADLYVVLFPEQLRSLSKVEMLHGPQLDWVNQPPLLLWRNFPLPSVPQTIVCGHAHLVLLVAVQNPLDSSAADVEGSCQVTLGPHDTVPPALATQIEPHDALRDVRSTITQSVDAMTTLNHKIINVTLNIMLLKIIYL